MQIKDQVHPSKSNWALIDDSKGLANGFRIGLGFTPLSTEEDETVTVPLDYDSEPEPLEEKDRVGEDTRPRK